MDSHQSAYAPGDRTTLEIDGVAVFVNVPQTGLPEGDLGLITRNARAQFDDIEARAFDLVRPYIENFNDLVANRWTVQSGNWSAASGAYVSSSVAATTVTLSPSAELNDFVSPTLPVSYTFKTRMLNPYGGSGNLVGVVLLSRRAKLQRNRLLTARRSKDERSEKWCAHDARHGSL